MGASDPTLRWSAAALAALAALALGGCDPRIDRDNPHDPLPATISGRALRVAVDGPEPGPATVRLIRGDGRPEAVEDVDPASGAFTLSVPAGPYTLTAEAPGHASETLALDVASGQAIDDVYLELLDGQPPVAPTLTLPPGPVNTREIVARVEHPEAGAGITIRLAGDAEATGEGAERGLRLTGGDGLKRITAVAVDRAGNTSSAASAIVELDTRPPSAGALLLAGGACEVRSRFVDAELSGTDAPWVGFEAVPGACGECPDDIPCDRASARVNRVELAPARGAQCVCRVLCDDAGNRTAAPPVAVHLGPYEPRPVPVLTAVEPSVVPARASACDEVVVRGADLAGDTVVDIGPFTALPCARRAGLDAFTPCAGGPPPDEPPPDPDGCAVADVPDGYATACVVTLPPGLLTFAGTFPVRLRTPAPVEGGAGLSADVRWLTLDAPLPLVDRIEPHGVALGPDRPSAVTVTLDAHDLTDNVEIQLAGRPPVEMTITRGGPERPDAARVEATFDLSGLAPDAAGDVSLFVINDDAEVELPFGLTPAVTACGPVCRIPTRRTRPSGLPGHVAVELTPPRNTLGTALTLAGASSWTVLDADGAPLMRSATAHGLAGLRLPGPQPAARLIADVPAHAGGLIEVTAGQAFPEPPDLCPRARVAPQHGPASAALFADLDLDGGLEGIMAHPETGQLTVDGQVIQVGGSPSALAVADLNGDGWPDVLVGDPASRTITARPGLGDADLGPPVPLPAVDLAGPVAALAVTDVDGDRRPDVLAGFDGPGGGLARWIVAADGRILPPTVIARDAPVSMIAARSTTRPGVPDVIFGGPGGLSVWTAGGPTRPLLDGQPDLGSAWVEVLGRDRLGTVRLLGSDAAGIWTLTRRPGAGWVLDGERIPVSPAFRSLGAYDTDGDGQPEVFGVDEVLQEGLGEIRHALLTVQPGRPDRPVSTVGYADDSSLEGPEPTPWPPLAVALYRTADNVHGRALGRDGAPRALEPCVGVEPGPQGVPPTPGLPPVSDGRAAWLDVDGDGFADLIAQGDDGLVTAFGPCDARVVCEPAFAGEGAALAVTRAADGSPVVVIGEGRQVRIGPLRGDGAPGSADAEVGVGAPVRAVQAVALGDERLAVAVTDNLIHVIGPGVASGLPLPAPAGRVIAADARPEPPGAARSDEIVARVAEALLVWAHDGDGWRALGDPAPVGPALDWTLADVDGDGLLDRVDLLLDGDALAIAVYRGTGDAALFEAASLAPPIRVDAYDAGPVALAAADLNVDGLTDVIVGQRRLGARVSNAVRVLLGRGDGALAPAVPAWPPCLVEFDAVDADPLDPALTVAAADVTGDGRPEIVATLDRSICVAAVVDDGPVQSWIADPAPPAPDADGRLRVPLHHPAAWFEHATLVAQSDAPMLSGALIGPRGERVELPPVDPVGGAVAWSSLDGGPLAGLMGRQPAGEWVVELEPGPDGPPVTAVELLVGVRWQRPRHPACGAGNDPRPEGVCVGGRLLDRAPGPAGDCDFDGVPDASDPCPAQARWPADPDALCGQPTHRDCPL